MSHSPLSLCFAYPEDLLAESQARACLALLSGEERARWQRFRIERRRREFLASHALLRTALSQRRAVAPEAWRFQANAYGKPVLDPECGLRFNLSDSHGLAACLIAEGAEAGLDLEPCDRASEIAAIAGDVFSPHEVAQLQSLDEPNRLDRSLSLWTLKEAYIKARGMGLSLPLKKFSFLFCPQGAIRLQLDADFPEEPGRRWRFCLLDFAAHRLALVIEDFAACEPHIWEARSLPAAPLPLPAIPVMWFSAS